MDKGPADGEEARPPEAVREIQDRLLALADNLPHAMVYQVHVPADGSGQRFSFVSGSCLQLNGVTAEAAMADPNLLNEMIVPEDRARLAAVRAEAQRDFKPFDVEVGFIAPDGRRRQRRLSSAPRRQPDGSVLWDGIQLDIDDSYLVRAALETEQNRLALAVEATGLGLWDFDIVTGALHWDAAVKAIHGLPGEAEITYQVYLDRLHPEDRDRVVAIYQEAVASGAGGYRMEHRTLDPDGVIRWVLGCARIIRDEAGTPLRLYGSTLDITERKRAEEHLQLMVHELNHRVKNAMSIVQAISARTLRNSLSPAEAADQLGARLLALARTHDLLTAESWAGADMAQVLARTLRPIAGEPHRLTIAGPPVRLHPSAAQTLSLVFHELGTNAMKYGALSADAGRVEVGWSIDTDQDQLGLTWRESGGPAVSVPTRRGFGTQLIERGLAVEMGGSAVLDYRPEGLVCTIEGSLERLGPR